MKLRALLLLCAASCMMMATTREERLEDSVRKGDASFVAYHLARLGKDGASKVSQKKLLEGLVPFADKILKDEKSHSSGGSKDVQLAKLALGATAILFGYIFGVAQDSKNRTDKGIVAIYKNWKSGVSQKFHDYNDAAMGISFFAVGLGFIFDGTRCLVRTDQKILEAQDVKKILIAHQEELGS